MAGPLDFPFLTYLEPSIVKDELDSYFHMHPIDEGKTRYLCGAILITGGIPGIGIDCNAYRLVDGVQDKERLNDGGTLLVGEVKLVPQPDSLGRQAWVVEPIKGDPLTESPCFRPILEWLKSTLPARNIVGELRSAAVALRPDGQQPTVTPRLPKSRERRRRWAAAYDTLEPTLKSSYRDYQRMSTLLNDSGNPFGVDTVRKIVAAGDAGAFPDSPSPRQNSPSR